MLRMWVLSSGVMVACTFDRNPAALGPEPDHATLFVADVGTGLVHRFALTPDDDIPPPLSIPVTNALTPIVRPLTGELLVGEMTTKVIDRFLTPLGRPKANGTITGEGISEHMGKMAFVDDELWVVNAGFLNVNRIVFDGRDAATVGSVPAINGRGIAVRATTRDVFITQCCGTDTILNFEVAGDHGIITAKPSITGNGLSNPHGLLFTPWGELFVANPGTQSILRFVFDVDGNVIPNGSITGNGVAVPIDLAMSPWRELFVTEQSGGGLVSRFTFDGTDTAIPNGTIPIAGAQNIAWSTLVVN